MSPPSRWDATRAIILSVVLLLQMLDAVPLPELRERHLQNPVAQSELKRWTQFLQSTGVDITQDELAAFGLRVGGVAGAFRKSVLRPWSPFRRVTGTGQDWSLFSIPEPAAGRLVVEGHMADGTVTTFYRAPGGNGDALDTMLEYRRLRGVYDSASDRPQPRKIYRQFGRWLSARLMADHPDIMQVEVRLDRHQIRTPDQPLSPPDERRHARMYTRADLELEGLLEATP
ncbi:MAG: hypothetical protein CL927_18470 [Deltaproteobacteria bacterium]|nr:hypothetical protein [Deltaproteobacteria bacterium]HCH65967.1 hypothetical protein [Deltaproteobacteria bacterium]